MRFRITADATFDAENIDDAFEKLASHFRALEDGSNQTLDFLGSMEISPTAGAEHE